MTLDEPTLDDVVVVSSLLHGEVCFNVNDGGTVQDASGVIGSMQPISGDGQPQGSEALKGLGRGYEELIEASLVPRVLEALVHIIKRILINLV